MSLLLVCGENWCFRSEHGPKHGPKHSLTVAGEASLLPILCLVLQLLHFSFVVHLGIVLRGANPGIPEILIQPSRLIQRDESVITLIEPFLTLWIQLLSVA